MVSWRRSSGPPSGPPPSDDDRRTPGEPTPATGDDVPDVVLDELRQAFTGAPPAAGDAPAGRVGEPALDLDDLPPAEFDDLSGPLAGGAGPGAGSGVSAGRPGAGDLDDLPTPDDLDDLDGFDDFDDLPLLDDLDDLPEAEPWVVEPPGALPGAVGPGSPGTAPDAPAPVFESSTGDVRVMPRDRSVGAAPVPVRADPLPPVSPAAAGPGPTGPRPTIVIGGGDELPDAVFLDEAVGASGGGTTAVVGPGEPGEPGERGTIVIGDELEASGAFDAVPIARSMDPRVRARRIAVKRAKGRRRLLWVAGIAGVVLVVVAVVAVFASGLFAVERVDVQGAAYTRARYGDQLQAVVDDLMGEPVLLVDTRAAELALEALPWVERAFVRTDFPDRVFIDVRERQPLATFVGSDGRYRVIDRNGFVLDVLAGRPSDYLLIDGLGPDLEAGGSAGTPYAAAAQMVGALPGEIRALTVAATVDPTTGDLGLVLQWVPSGEAATGEAATGGAQLVSVRIGSFNGLDTKLARLLQLVRDGLDGTSPIDVSTDDVIG